MAEKNPEPICTVCNDTHEKPIGERMVMCTSCPKPCERCRQGGNGPYCETTPCSCSCHDGRPGYLDRRPEGASSPARPEAVRAIEQAQEAMRKAASALRCAAGRPTDVDLDDGHDRYSDVSRCCAAIRQIDDAIARIEAEACGTCADPVDSAGYSWLICDKCGRHYSPRPAYAPPMDQIAEAERRGYAAAMGKVRAIWKEWMDSDDMHGVVALAEIAGLFDSDTDKRAKGA